MSTTAVGLAPAFAPLPGNRIGLPDGLHCAKEVRILVLDDEPATCLVIQGALAGMGFTVDTVSDPRAMESHLAATAAEPYHLIVMDYVLPGLEPEAVLCWIRDHQSTASIIVVTAYPSVDSALNCLRARTFDYLTKPFGVAQIRQAVTRCLESKGLLRMTEDALRESLGAAVREKRKARGLTLSQLAESSDVSLGYLSQIELGKSSPAIETLYRVCLALNIKMADLFTAMQK